MRAAANGDVDLVQLLISHGARTELRDVYHRTVLFYAVPHPAVLKILLDAGAQIDAKVSVTQYPASNK
jgi:ankyrin repeat protein